MIPGMFYCSNATTLFNSVSITICLRINEMQFLNANAFPPVLVGINEKKSLTVFREICLKFVYQMISKGKKT